MKKMPTSVDIKYIEGTETKTGKVTVTKPKAGPRNRALVTAETAAGMKMTMFLIDGV